MPFDLDTAAVEPLFARTRALFSPAGGDDVLAYAGQGVAVALEGVVQDSLYPPASGHALPLYYERRRKDGTTYRSKFKSLRQQRLVMALVKAGKVPYKRTGQLGRSIIARVDVAEAGLVVIAIGTPLRYAPYVIDRLMQSHYHAGTWTPLQNTVDNAMPDMRRVARNAAVKRANEVLNG